MRRGGGKQQVTIEDIGRKRRSTNFSEPNGSLAASPLHPHPSFGSYPLPHALDCSDHTTLKSVSMQLEDGLAITSVDTISRPVDRKL